MPEMKLELVPVSDIDRVKAFYEKAGFTLEVDTRPSEGRRVVQFTAPGSACSIVFGTGIGDITAMTPGSVKGRHLVVSDIDTARSVLLNRGSKSARLRISKRSSMLNFATLMVMYGCCRNFHQR